jgi:hypothetical protein
MKLKAEKSMALEDLPIEVLTGTKGNKSVRVSQGGEDSDPISNMLVNGFLYTQLRTQKSSSAVRCAASGKGERKAGAGFSRHRESFSSRPKRKTR